MNDLGPAGIFPCWLIRLRPEPLALLPQWLAFTTLRCQPIPPCRPRQRIVSLICRPTRDLVRLRERASPHPYASEPCPAASSVSLDPGENRVKNLGHVCL